MIIKIVAETELEKKRFNENFGSEEIVHSGVKEYFVFGNKTGAEGFLIDFHEWQGSPRYLMGNLRYFFEVVNDERRVKDASARNRGPQKLDFPKKAVADLSPDEIEKQVGAIEHPKIVMENKAPRIVKRGEVGNIQTIDVSNLKKNVPSTGPRIVQMSELKGENPNPKNYHINPINLEPLPNIPRVDFSPYGGDPSVDDEMKGD